MAALRKDYFPEDLRPILSENRIDGCIAVQAVQDSRDTEFLLNLASRHDFIKGFIGWTDLSRRDVTAELERLSQFPKLKGFRYTSYDEKGEFLNDPSFRNGISKLEKFKFTFDLLVFEYQLSAAINLVRDFPFQSFILDHLGKPEIHPDGPSSQWEKNIRALSGYKNVYAKLSGLLTLDTSYSQEKIIPYVEIMAEAFGAERLMFGSDWPVCFLASEYGDSLSLMENLFGRSEESFEKIIGGSAMKVYDI